MGQRIVAAAWIADVTFGVTAIPAALGVEVFEAPSLAVSTVLFFVAIGVWVVAFGTAAMRSARGDDIVVGSLFLVQGDTPRTVRVQLFAALGVSLAIAAATAMVEPFGVLVPMLSLGLIGLWGARHGQFPARRARRA